MEDREFSVGDFVKIRQKFKHCVNNGWAPSEFMIRYIRQGFDRRYYCWDEMSTGVWSDRIEHVEGPW